MLITSGMISAWRMEEASGTLKDYFALNNLTATDLTYKVTGKVDKTVTFAGTTTSQALIADVDQTNLNIGLTDDRSFAFWFKSTTGIISIMIDKRNTGDSPTPSYFQFALYNTGQVGPSFVDSATNIASFISTTTGLNDGNWHLIVCTFTRSGTGLRLYIDNVEDANSPVSASSVGAVTNVAPFRMGRSGVSTGYEYAGNLDEVVIWNRVITQAERDFIWNGGAGRDIFLPITTGVLSMWRMEETSGNLVDQFCINTLTASNLTYSVAGKVNSAISFNGTNSIATITDASQKNLNIGSTEDRTFAFWFKTSVDQIKTIIGKHTIAGPPFWQILQLASGKIQVSFNDASNSASINPSTTSGLNDGIFHLVICTFTRSATGLRLYIDNVEDGSSPVDSSAVTGSITSSADFNIGGFTDIAGFNFNGVIDEVIIWNRVITQYERNAIWNSGNGVNILPSITDNVITAWRMEDLSGNVTDYIDGNNLTPTNLTYQVAGKVNKAISFNGSTSLANITDANQSQLNVGLTDQRSVAVWFKTSTATEQTIFCKPDDQGGASPIAFECILDSSGGVNVVFGDLTGSNYAYCRSNSGYEDGNWHLMVCTFTRTVAGCRLFIDNVEYTGGLQPSPQDGSVVGDLTNAYDYQIGARILSVAPFFNGVMDEMIHWNRVLSATDRALIWNDGAGIDIFAGPVVDIKDGLISAWRMEDFFGNILDQYNNNTLTPSSTPYPSPIYDIEGKINNALGFYVSQTNYPTYVTISDGSQTGLNIGASDSKTFAFWFKTAKTGADNAFISKRAYADSPYGGYEISLNSSGGVTIRLLGNSPFTNIFVSSVTTGLADGNWHFIVCTFTRSGTGLRLYIDNNLDGNFPVNTSSAGDLTTSGNFYLGLSGVFLDAGGALVGGLDEVMVWNRVLAATDVSYLWNGGAGINLFGPVPIVFQPIPSQVLRGGKYYSNGKLKFALRINGGFVYIR